VVNYDLPWNPMRVEQRIGRVHRLGQQHPCHIYNLFTVDTIEEHILRLLHEKINLFRQVVGELDVILRHVERRGSLEGRILNIVMTAEDRAEVDARLDRLGREFRAASRRFAADEESARDPELPLGLPSPEASW
jgi:superfamily II DNA/RNA helicase